MKTLLLSEAAELGNEAKLLLYCARTQADTETGEQIRAFAGNNIDWACLIQMAAHHSVLPLLYKNLSKYCPSSVPAGVLESLKSDYRYTAQRNMFLTREMLRLLGLLEAGGVKAIPFKGPVLALEAFGSLSLRQFADIDVLVRKKDVQAVKTVLLSHGYRQEFELSATQEAAYIESEHAFQFLHEEAELVVEIHWRLDDRYLAFPLPSESLWQRSRLMPFCGTSILTFAPEDLFLYLCMHGAKHYWERLEWICCLPEVIRANPQMNWRLVVRNSQRLHAERILYLGLLLAHQITETDYTSAALRLLEPDTVALGLASQVWQKLFSDEMTHDRRQVYRYSFYLKTRERLWDRLRIVYYHGVRMPHPKAKDWKVFPLPSYLHGLLYLLRPMRLIRQYGLRSFKRVL